MTKKDKKGQKGQKRPLRGPRSPLKGPRGPVKGPQGSRRKLNFYPRGTQPRTFEAVSHAAYKKAGGP